MVTKPYPWFTRENMNFVLRALDNTGILYRMFIRLHRPDTPQGFFFVFPTKKNVNIFTMFML